MDFLTLRKSDFSTAKEINKGIHIMVYDCNVVIADDLVYWFLRGFQNNFEDNLFDVAFSIESALIREYESCIHIDDAFELLF
jgi:hypothetical protein